MIYFLKTNFACSYPENHCPIFNFYMAIPNQIFRKRFFMKTVGESKNNNQQKIWIANRIELQKISDFRYCFACFSLSFCTFGTEIVISIFNVRKGMPSQNSTDLLVVKRDLNRCVQSNSRFEKSSFLQKKTQFQFQKDICGCSDQIWKYTLSPPSWYSNYEMVLHWRISWIDWQGWDGGIPWKDCFRNRQKG